MGCTRRRSQDGAGEGGGRGLGERRMERWCAGVIDAAGLARGEMGEDLVDEFGLLDARDDAQRTATHATVFDVDVEDALEPLNPHTDCGMLTFRDDDVKDAIEADTREADMNPMHEANRRGWDAASAGWQATVERNVDWRRCPADPTVALIKEELELLGDVAGRDVCVLGSGDNLAVLALAGMGARLTSVDISQAQLDTAASRAGEIGLDIAFLCADAVDLRELGDESFDLIYTGGHVAVWVSDLKRHYAEACRILRRAGHGTSRSPDGGFRGRRPGSKARTLLSPSSSPPCYFCVSASSQADRNETVRIGLSPLVSCSSPRLPDMMARYIFAITLSANR